MLNYLWAAMIAIGIIYAAFTGNLEAITNAALDSAGEGISLCITTAGVMALWMGLMEIAQQAGLVAKLTRGISPLLGLLFPRIPKGHKAREYIATNIIANVLGLGWACTPAGLKAMEEPGEAGGGEGESRVSGGFIPGASGQRAAGEGGRKEKRIKGSKGPYGQQGNVYFFDTEYFLFAVDSCEYDRLPQPVWKYPPGGNHRAFHPGHAGQHSGGGGVLQNKGPEMKSVQTGFSIASYIIIWLWKSKWKN